MIRAIDFELSSICNAGCPVCSRRRYGKFTEFKQTYWTLEEVKRVLDRELLLEIKHFQICGNFGDGMGNPHIVDICKYIKSVNKNCEVHIATNGGIGTKEDYRELAKNKINITFGIDGYGDKNELYRINAKWDKVYENLKTYIESIEDSYTHSRIQFLLWDQTRDQILPMLDLMQELQVKTINLMEPFTQGEFTRGYDMKGVYTHSLTFNSTKLTKKLHSRIWYLEELNELKKLIKKEDLGAKPIVVEENENVLYPNLPTGKPYVKEEVNIEREQTPGKRQSCFSLNYEDNYNFTEALHSLYITHDGYLMPCCMIPPEFSLKVKHSLGNETPDQKEILNKVLDLGLNNFSLKNKTVLEVFESGILDKFVYNNLRSNSPLAFCQKACSRECTEIKLESGRHEYKETI